MSNFDREDHVKADRYLSKARLNLNDLLQRRVEEKKIEKKTNVLIFGGVAGLAAVILLILSF